MVLNSKILLFGEYSILHGSQALALPYSRFSGQLTIPCGLSESNKSLASNKSLHDWYQYIESHDLFPKPKIRELKNDIDKGLYFKSNIPQGYGLGSSGALTAAIYQKYFKQENDEFDINLLKSDLVRLESFFHGSSSGFDPLVSFLNKPLLLENDTYLFPTIRINGVSVFLIDSKLSRNTHHLVAYFNQLIQNKPELKQILTNLSDKIIAASLTHSIDLLPIIDELVKFQKLHFPLFYPQIPDFTAVQSAFTNKLLIKICGAGGGGFFLGFCQSNCFTDVQSAFTQLNVTTYPICA